MSRRRRLIDPMLIFSFIAFANLGCATTIAGKYPHLERRAICLRVPGVDPDATDFIFTTDHVPVSNVHPELVDRIAPTARTVFEYDPQADPRSTRYLPAPYRELQCPERFSILPARESETSPLPDASFESFVQQPPAKGVSVPEAVAKQLANCPSDRAGRLGAVSYTMSFKVYVTEDGQAVSAYVERSTLGDRETEACMVEALRTMPWPVIEEAVAITPISRALIGQAWPVEPAPDSGPKSGVRLRAPIVEPPPAGRPLPLLGTIPLLGPVLVGGLVFITINILPNETAPAWLAELNPITRRPYTSLDEYKEVQRLSPDEIKRQRQAHIKATQSQPPPAPIPQPQPAPMPQPQPAQQPDCPRNERFVPRETHNATGCFTKKGNLQCYAGRHPPCAGVHTHGTLRYQEIRRGICTAVEDKAVRCEGPFTISGPCGSVSTTLCGTEGTATSGIFKDR